MANEIALGKDEHRLHEGEFMSNLIFAWVKAKLVLTNKRLTGYSYKSPLGIPLGSQEINLPLSRIARVEVSTKIRMFRVILGVLLLVAGPAALTTQGTQGLVGPALVGTLVLILLGVLLLGTAWVAFLVVHDNSGSSSAVSSVQKNKLKQFAQRVNTQLVED